MDLPVANNSIASQAKCVFGGSLYRLCEREDCDICFSKSFANHSRATCWSPINTLKPRNVSMFSNKKFWFDCGQCTHTFEIVLSSVSRGRWCPFCSHQKLCDIEGCTWCFANSFANHPKSQFWSQRNERIPRQVFLLSDKKFWFDCDKCAHSFEIGLGSITRDKHWCPFCAHQKLCEDEGCTFCFANSFASHPKSQFWSPKNTKKPRQIFKTAQRQRYLFYCHECHHEFLGLPGSINDGCWCPYCAGRVLCDNMECQFCLQHSFASHPKSPCWSSQNTKMPRFVHKCSGEKIQFVCDKCQHKFTAPLLSISSGSWCPFCCFPPIKLCNEASCEQCFRHSFASDPKSVFWSPKNRLTPRETFKCASKKIWFDCNKCQRSFCVLLGNVSCGDAWCPFCHNKTEAKLLDILRAKVPDITRQWRPEWCCSPTTGRGLPFDFALPARKIIIELDGGQHFAQVSNWAPPEESQARDKYKMLCAWRHGFTIIRLLQEEVLDDRADIARLFAMIDSSSGDSAGIQLRICTAQEELYAPYLDLYRAFVANPAIEVALGVEDEASGDEETEATEPRS
jgi:hypothetical protein